MKTILFHRLRREVHGCHRRYPDGTPDVTAEASARSRLNSVTMPATGWPDKGYDPAYGARPLKRVIQKYVQDPLVRGQKRVLAGEIADGPDRRHLRPGRTGLLISNNRQGREKGSGSEHIKSNGPAIAGPF